MDAARLMEFLKTEFGICSREEFELAVSQMPGINLGLFTMPLRILITSCIITLNKAWGGIP